MLVSGTFLTMSAHDGLGFNGVESDGVVKIVFFFSDVDRDCFWVVLLTGSP